MGAIRELLGLGLHAGPLPSALPRPCAASDWNCASSRHLKMSQRVFGVLGARDAAKGSDRAPQSQSARFAVQFTLCNSSICNSRLCNSGGPHLLPSPSARPPQFDTRTIRANSWPPTTPNYRQEW